MELVNQEAGMSTEIELKVIRNEIVDYTYPWQGNQVSTQKVEIILQSKIAEQYCLGVAKMQKKKTTQGDGDSLADWHNVEVQNPYTPQRQAGFHPHFMPHRYRSAQGASTSAATEHGFPRDASANNYHRLHIRIAADAAI